ncbi:MAG: caspase domain-containing protein, partial [Bacteroidota bacterium]
MKQIVLFLYLTLHACAQAYAQFPGKSAPPRLSALVVGVSDYKHSKINDLEFARRDAEQFARLLGCASNVKVDTIIKLLDEDATVANMDMALKFLKSCIDDTTGRKPKPDYIVLFFSGHGQLSSFDEDQEGYFIMHDTDNASSQDMGYPHRNIVKFIKQRRNKCKFLVISDACHAGRLTGAEEQLKSTTLPVLGELSDIAAVNTGAVFELLSSEGAGQSYEDPSLQHGIFTFYLIKGALGDAEADANKDGLIQNNEIGNYIQAKVNKAEPRQSPVFNSNRGVFLQFDPCMDYSYDKDLALADKREIASREVRAPKSPVVLITRFDSLLHYGPLCSEDKNSAYGELKRFKKADPEVYEDMRSRYIVAVLNEDADIMHRYLNQDAIPWKSKFADIEKEIQMQKSLLDLLRKDDFLVQKTSS